MGDGGFRMEEAKKTALFFKSCFSVVLFELGFDACGRGERLARRGRSVWKEGRRGAAEVARRERKEDRKRGAMAEREREVENKTFEEKLESSYSTALARLTLSFFLFT